jgi:hypothetical protein
MKVTVLFARHRKWWAIFDDLLCLAEGVPFSHVAILLQDDFSQFVYESQAPRGRRVPLTEWLEKYKITEEFLIDENFIRHSHEYYYLYRMTQLKYSPLQILAIGLGLLNKALLERNKWLEINGHKAAICTELVGNFLRVAYGVEIEKSADLLGLKDVKMLVQRMKKLG